jgi:hypothetical protein
MSYKVVSLFHHASVQDIKYIDADTLYEECTKRHQKVQNDVFETAGSELLLVLPTEVCACIKNDVTSRRGIKNGRRNGIFYKCLSLSVIFVM